MKPMLLTAENWHDNEIVKAVLDHAAWGGGVVGIDPSLSALTKGHALVLVVDRALLAEMPGLPALARRHGAQLAAVDGPAVHGLRTHGGIGAILRSPSEQLSAPV